MRHKNVQSCQSVIPTFAGEGRIKDAGANTRTPTSQIRMMRTSGNKSRGPDNRGVDNRLFIASSSWRTVRWTLTTKGNLLYRAPSLRRHYPDQVPDRPFAPFGALESQGFGVAISAGSSGTPWRARLMPLVAGGWQERCGSAVIPILKRFTKYLITDRALLKRNQRPSTGGVTQRNINPTRID